MNKVKVLCFQQDITQKELASMVGVSQPTVSDWFNNKKDPSGKRLQKLASVLGVSRAEVLCMYDSGQTPQEITHDTRAEAKRLLEGLSDEQYNAALQYIQFLKSQK